VVVVRWSRSSGQGAGESKEDFSGHKPSHHASANTFKTMVRVAQWKQGTYLSGRKCLLMLFINSLHLVVMSVRVVINLRPRCTSLDSKHPNSMLDFHSQCIPCYWFPVWGPWCTVRTCPLCSGCWAKPNQSLGIFAPKPPPLV